MSFAKSISSFGLDLTLVMCSRRDNGWAGKSVENDFQGPWPNEIRSSRVDKINF